LALLWCDGHKDNTRATAKKRKIRGRASQKIRRGQHYGERENISNVSNKGDEEEAKAQAPKMWGVKK
jgi:hypothetical protein